MNQGCYPLPAEAVSPALFARAGNVLCPHENLVVKQVAVTSVDIDADALVLFDARGVAKRFGPLNETLLITAAGVNGLDVGAEGASRWYHVFGIGKPDGSAPKGLLSESPTAPILPAGFTFKGYLGAVYNSSGSDFVAFLQRGREVSGASVAALAAGSSTNFASVSLASVVPPTATEVELAVVAYTSTGGPNIVTAVIAPAGSATTATYGSKVYSFSTDTTGYQNHATCLIETAQQVVYRVSGTNARLDLAGKGWKY